jgi:uncharacterized protein (TIGR04255 family)
MYSSIHMTPSATHPRLTKAPLVEAIFDLRYNTDVSLEAIRADVQKSLPEFRREERIEGQMLTIQLGPDGKQSIQDSDPQQPLPDVILYRFHNPDTNEFIQLGQGIISVNTVGYRDFSNFLSIIKKVVEAHAKIAFPSGYRRLTLRYINHLSLQDNPEKVFDWLAPIPSTWNSRAILQNTQQVVLRVGEDLQNVTIAYPQVNIQTGNHVMVLDIDHHVDFFLPVLPDLTQVYSWIENAHDQVYKTFKSALKDDYFKELG